MSDGREVHNLDQWQWQTSKDIHDLKQDISHLHTCLETKGEAIRDDIQQHGARLDALETLRERLYGGAVVVSILAVVGMGFIWYIVAKWAPAMDAIVRALPALEKGVPKP